MSFILFFSGNSFLMGAFIWFYFGFFFMGSKKNKAELSQCLEAKKNNSPLSKNCKYVYHQWWMSRLGMYLTIISFVIIVLVSILTRVFSWE